MVIKRSRFTIDKEIKRPKNLPPDFRPSDDPELRTISCRDVFRVYARDLQALFDPENIPTGEYEPSESVRRLRHDIGGMDALFTALKSHPQAGIPASKVDLD